MEYYADKVTVTCNLCKQTHTTEMVYGLDSRYEDDFEINCPNHDCKNWETGSPNLQSFELVKYHMRRELTEREAQNYEWKKVI